MEIKKIIIACSLFVMTVQGSSMESSHNGASASSASAHSSCTLADMELDTHALSTHLSEDQEVNIAPVQSDLKSIINGCDNCIKKLKGLDLKTSLYGSRLSLDECIGCFEKYVQIINFITDEPKKALCKLWYGAKNKREEMSRYLLKGKSDQEIRDYFTMQISSIAYSYLTLFRIVKNFAEIELKRISHACTSAKQDAVVTSAASSSNDSLQETWCTVCYQNKPHTILNCGHASACNECIYGMIDMQNLSKLKCEVCDKVLALEDIELIIKKVPSFFSAELLHQIERAKLYQAIKFNVHQLQALCNPK